MMIVAADDSYTTARDSTAANRHRPLPLHVEHGIKTLSDFYQWAAAEGHLSAVPFTYSQRMVIRPDGASVEAARRAPPPGPGLGRADLRRSSMSEVDGPHR